MSYSHKVTIAVISAGLIAGCATNTKHISQEFGAAHAETMNKQIVTTAIAQTAPEMHPQKANAAVTRYLEDEIKEPKETSEIVTDVD